MCQLHLPSQLPKHLPNSESWCELFGWSEGAQKGRHGGVLATFGWLSSVLTKEQPLLPRALQKRMPTSLTSSASYHSRRKDGSQFSINPKPEPGAVSVELGHFTELLLAVIMGLSRYPARTKPDRTIIAAASSSAE